jgi:hypothetical protein
MKRKIQIFALCICFTIIGSELQAQCCAGGSGSPIAGDASKSVLKEKQLKFGSNFQYINTKKFYTGDSLVNNFLDKYTSSYLYTELAFGLSKKLTISIESGYWLNKSQDGLDTIGISSSSGIGDIIVFPKYNVINRSKDDKTFELTLGLGFKIPLGRYNDSLAYVEPFSGNTYYLSKPLVLQTSSGSQDLIFRLFLNRGFTKQKLNFFANVMYIKKGWNPIGEKMGDYFKAGLFVSRRFVKKLQTTLQISYEWVDQMKINNDILMVAYPNYDPFATGSKKLFLVPQFNYSLKKNLTFYTHFEIPVYQSVTKTQIGSQFQATVGFAVFFDTGKQEE